MSSENHKRYLALDFDPGVPDGLCSDDELEVLTRYGAWMAALMHGAIDPYTESQKRFVEMCQGLCSAESDYEVAWSHYMKRKIWETENPGYVGTENKVLADLGITGIGWGKYGSFR